jgi:hypothetical protein
MSLKDSKVFNAVTSALEASSIPVLVAAVLYYDEGILWGFFEPFGLIGILAFGALCWLAYLFVVTLLLKIYSDIYDAIKSE